jgi:predicted dithiol-disulfide oxidoreductase (DUF899 family)
MPSRATTAAPTWLNGTWHLLDRAPKGRGHDLEDWRRHDEYEPRRRRTKVLNARS